MTGVGGWTFTVTVPLGPDIHVVDAASLAVRI
jgi:hypothetical protein